MALVGACMLTNPFYCTNCCVLLVPDDYYWNGIVFSNLFPAVASSASLFLRGKGYVYSLCICRHYEPLMSLWLRTTYLLLEVSCVKDTAQRGEKMKHHYE